MKKPIYLCIPTMTQYDLAIKEIESAEAGTLKPDKYIVIDNGGTFNYLLKESNLDLTKIEVLNLNSNLGCARSWNHFLNNYNDGICIIANDDIQFESDAIEHLVNCYNEYKDNPGVGIITLTGINANSHYCCFIVTQAAIEKVGYFDEEFYPAYYEDCDYDQRLRVAGLKTIFAEQGVYNHVGSATYKAYTPEQLEAHHITFVKNRDYYEAKWGGELYKETFITPFNKGV